MNDPVNIEDNFNWYTFGDSCLLRGLVASFLLIVKNPLEFISIILKYGLRC